MRRAFCRGALIAAFAFAGGGLWAEASIVFYGSTGLSVDGLVGYLGEKHAEDRIVVNTDESAVYLLFLWDSTDFELRLKVNDDAGKVVGDYDLRANPRVLFEGPGRFVCELSATSGSGHWVCVLLSGKVWNSLDR